MIVTVSSSGLTQAKWYEYVVRFVVGGLVTAVAGALAKKFGPSFGGIFLAFPAIFAASATLVEKHERERKEQKGMWGVYRGRHAASAEAAGAAMGGIGLIVFAWVITKLLPRVDSWQAIVFATLVWAAVSSAVWFAWKRDAIRRVCALATKPFNVKQDRWEKGNDGGARRNRT